MEKLLFKDGQTLQVQSITATNGTLRVNVINNSYEQLKHLFTDPLTTGRIAVEGEDGGEAEVFENYTIFSFIRENAGGIFIVEMQQDGEDTDTKLEKLKTDMEKLKEQSSKGLLSGWELSRNIIFLEYARHDGGWICSLTRQSRRRDNRNENKEGRRNRNRLQNHRQEMINCLESL